MNENEARQKGFLKNSIQSNIKMCRNYSNVCLYNFSFTEKYLEENRKCTHIFSCSSYEYTFFLFIIIFKKKTSMKHTKKICFSFSQLLGLEHVTHVVLSLSFLIKKNISDASYTIRIFNWNHSYIYTHNIFILSE